MDNESAERAVDKIISLYREDGVQELTIERQYLLEIFSHDLLDLSSDDGLPILKSSALYYLNTRGIITIYRSKDVTFSKSLVFNIPELKGALIVSDEGLPIASMLPQGVDAKRMAAMTATLLSLSKKQIVEMQKGDFDLLYIKGIEGYLLIMQAGPRAVLLVSTTKDVRLGLILLECRRICEKISKLI